MGHCACCVAVSAHAAASRRLQHPHQAVCGRGEGEEPADPPHTTEFDLAQQPDRLQPSEDLFDTRTLVQLGLRISCQSMRGIRPALATETHTGIARIIRRRHGRGVGFLLEALLARPGFDQRAVEREVLVGQQMMGLGLRQDLLEERRGHLARQQAVLVLGEDGHIPHRHVQIETDKPAEQQVVLQLLH